MYVHVCSCTCRPESSAGKHDAQTTHACARWGGAQTQTLRTPLTVHECGPQASDTHHGVGRPARCRLRPGSMARRPRLAMQPCAQWRTGAPAHPARCPRWVAKGRQPRGGAPGHSAAPLSRPLSRPAVNSWAPPRGRAVVPTSSLASRPTPLALHQTTPITTIFAARAAAHPCRGLADTWRPSYRGRAKSKGQQPAPAAGGVRAMPAPLPSQADCVCRAPPRQIQACGTDGQLSASALCGDRQRWRCTHTHGARRHAVQGGWLLAPKREGEVGWVGGPGCMLISTGGCRR